MQACELCGTIFTAELPASTSAADYADYYHAGNLEVPAFVHRRLEQLVGSLERDRRLNRWLDVGCGAGTLMEAARDRGWEVIGTEIAEGMAGGMRARGFEIRIGELDQLDLPVAGFDVVSVVEVLEHLPEPNRVLAAAHRLLRPGGSLYVTTPHGRGISGRLLGTKWSVVSPPEHLQLFSVSGLQLAVERSGFVVRAVETRAVNPKELVQAARSRSAPVGPGDRVASGYRLNESLSSSRIGGALKRVANAALNAARLGDSIRLVAERPG
jgi:SAM-dependent methyltransferase